MKIFNEVLNKIDRGRSGLNTGLPMGFDRLVEYIPNINQGTYYLIGGETSSGKSAFVDNCFVYNPYDFIKSRETSLKLNIVYFSFEIEKTIKITKAIARKAYLDYGRLLDVNYILSRGKNRINAEDYTIVTSYRDYFYEMEDHLHIIDKTENPTGIWHTMLDYSLRVGKWNNLDKLDTFIPNDPNLYTIIIIDHLGLIKNERGYEKKQNIDKLSEYLILLLFAFSKNISYLCVNLHR